MPSTLHMTPLGTAFGGSRPKMGKRPDENFRRLYLKDMVVRGLGDS